MFTGLVSDLGEVTEIEHTGDGVRLTIASRLTGEIGSGDSVAVDGVCLTATDVNGQTFTTEVMNETLRLSSLAEVSSGHPVNLELAMRLEDRLGGHIVQGHVDGVGTISEVRPDGFARRVTVDAPEQVLRYVVHKGSISVNGVSLTIASTNNRSFTVSLIPETL